jgi:hypothetical protein
MYSVKRVFFSPSFLSTLNMVAADSSETLITFYEATRHHNRESSGDYEECRLLGCGAVYIL